MPMTNFELRLKAYNGGKLRGAQSKLATAVGVKSQTVNQWVSGKNVPDKDTREKVAAELRITETELMSLLQSKAAEYPEQLPEIIMRLERMEKLVSWLAARYQEEYGVKYNPDKAASPGRTAPSKRSHRESGS